MKHILSVITAIILSCANTLAQSDSVNLVVPRGPTIKVIELSRDAASQTGLLRIKFDSSVYPVTFMVKESRTILEVKNPEVKMVELPVRYTWTDDVYRSYDLHVVNSGGKTYVGNGFSYPSIADALE